MEQQDAKALKKARKKYKKGLRKARRPFKGLSVLSGILSVILIAVVLLAMFFDQTFYTLLGSSYYTVVKNSDDDAIYYSSIYDSAADKNAMAQEICFEVEAEGAVLLLNENNTLPLASGSKVSCFSHSSVDPVYGGTGSGATDADAAVSLRYGLETAGFSVNPTLWEFYLTGDGSDYERTYASLRSGGEYSINEVPWDVYTDEVLDSVSEYGDAAIVMFSRVGGEAADLPMDDCVDGEDGNYLALSDEEKDILLNLTQMKEEGTIQSIIVLLNSANAMELSFLYDESYSIDACLWIGDVGQTGMKAVGEILSGEVTPSGHLADTFCKDNLTSPASVNFTPSTYANADEVDLDTSDSNAIYYLTYAEGIYVGYRYYETRYEDTVMGTGNTEGYDYSADVAYAFGYGLSYTEFEWSDMSVEYDEDADQYLVTVTVTNVGDTWSGKDTVQIYAQSPYTDYDVEYGVEKASVVLCGFDKTDTLAPGESQTLVIEVDRSELASYDAYGEGTYIFEPGDYYLTAAADAHSAVNNILAAKGYSMKDGMDEDGNEDFVYSWTETEWDDSYSVSDNGTEIVNQFDNADLNLYDDGAQSITYLTRSDWEGTFPEAVVLSITDTMAEDLADRSYEVDSDTETEMPTTEADNGLSLIDLQGVDFDDPLWDDLLDQMSVREMANLVGNAFHRTMPAASINLPGTLDENGPSGLTASLLLTELDVTGFPSEDVMAATWNLDLIYEVGEAFGEDCLANGYSGLYGPGANTHRTPYDGRNFEYYSEDGFLSGKMASSEVAGIASRGVYVMLKHCVLNETETDREGLGTWANEQSIREIYLKAFQFAMEENESCGIMSAFNRLGTTWAGAHEGLLKNVLRGEWGAMGIFISDNTGFNSYMDGIEGVMAGSTMYDAMAKMQYRSFMNEGSDDAAVVTALREATHYNLYTIVNSSAMNGIASGDTVKLTTPLWLTFCRVLMVVFLVIFAGSTAMCILRGRKYKKENPKPKKAQ